MLNEILQASADAATGRDFGAIHLPDGAKPFQYGAFLFKQGRELAALARLWRQVNRAAFFEIFGNYGSHNLTAPVSILKMDLAQPLWVDRFRAASAIREFQEAQFTCARDLFMEEALSVCCVLRLFETKALALVFDACVELGPYPVLVLLRQHGHDPRVLATAPRRAAILQSSDFPETPFFETLCADKVYLPYAQVPLAHDVTLVAILNGIGFLPRRCNQFPASVQLVKSALVTLVPGYSFASSHYDRTLTLSLKSYQSKNLLRVTGDIDHLTLHSLCLDLQKVSS